MFDRLRWIVGAAAMVAAPALGQKDCNRTSTGLVPINDLGSGFYRGAQGGLYAGGSNAPPAEHYAAALQLARNIVPLDAQGRPDPNGAIVLVTIGMSNTRQESAEFIRQVGSVHNRHPRLVIVNAAQGGQDASKIRDPDSPYWTRVREELAAAGVTPAQVQAVWLKQAIAGPRDPFPDHPLRLKGYLGEIVRNIRSVMPGASLCFVSSRIYAGYALGQLNPEPYAYQGAFAYKWLIEDQVGGDASLNWDPDRGPVVAPLLLWGAYLWADGLAGRSDGLEWLCTDFADDGTHPSADGARKVAGMLVKFFTTDEAATPWFLGEGSPCRADLDGNGRLDIRDFFMFQSLYAQRDMRADFDGDGRLTVRDFLAFQGEFAAGCR